MTKSDELSVKQKKALPHLLNSSSIEKGCKAAGISTNTFYKWLKIQPFKKEYDRLCKEQYGDMIAMLTVNSSKAANTLVELLTEKYPPNIRRAAANDIVNHAAKFSHMEELEKRVESLERLKDEFKDKD